MHMNFICFILCFHAGLFHSIANNMPCPFLSKLPATFVKNYGQSLLNNFGLNCPIISRAAASFSHPDIGDFDAEVKKCPFLSKVDVSPVKEANTTMNEDITTDDKEQFFAYENYFQEQIRKKKMDHSYRVFKKVNRAAENFPAAREFTRGNRPITVWCSNDYLGISAHTEVKQAVVDAVNTYGAGAGGTRNISGNSTLHEALEAELAAQHKKVLLLFCIVVSANKIYILQGICFGLHQLLRGQRYDLVHVGQEAARVRNIFRLWKSRLNDSRHSEQRSAKAHFPPQ